MSCSKPKCQGVNQTLKEKLEIFSKLECSMKAVEVCKTYNFSQSTLSTWKKHKLKDMVHAEKVMDTKHNCSY